MLMTQMPMLIPKNGFILTKLYHPNNQFSFKLEKNKQITFLDVLVKRTGCRSNTNMCS